MTPCRISSLLITCLGLLTLFSVISADGANRLTLAVSDPNHTCQQGGTAFNITLEMSDLDAVIVGYQAFVAFDPNVLTFLSGQYSLPDPFGLPVIAPIVAIDGRIDLAAGINPFIGQAGTSDDAVLATLTFQAQPVIANTRVRFLNQVPPTQLTTQVGGILPDLSDSSIITVRPCSACLIVDFDCDQDVDFDDFERFVVCLNGPLATFPPLGCPLDDYALADTNADLHVDLIDFALFQNNATG
jgi:hypothetical protein